MCRIIYFITYFTYNLITNKIHSRFMFKNMTRFCMYGKYNFKWNSFKIPCCTYRLCIYLSFSLLNLNLKYIRLSSSSFSLLNLILHSMLYNWSSIINHSVCKHASKIIDQQRIRYDIYTKLFETWYTATVYLLEQAYSRCKT